ncbi:MAG: hypothetical protein RBR06_02100 [Desulfuromonadaceae bacterium]|nr:hypothetical protein [Desulfuromonadaceae bacterium]
MPLSKTLHPYWEIYLKELFEQLSKPSAEIPSTRCLTRKTFTSLHGKIIKNLSLPSTFPSGLQCLRLLSSMGLASEIDIDKHEGSAPSKEFYLLGVSSSSSPYVDPVEILQAYKPDGVICFFSALSYYELTTQFPTHHHIAIITDRMPAAKSEKSACQFRAKKKSPIKLGSIAFHYQETPFYTVTRSRSTIPSIKNRRLNPKTNIKMTSKEQTLLDTLHYPLHCGGPEVILEAWDTLLKNLDEGNFVKIIKQINSSHLTRRLGALFDYLGYHPQIELCEILEESKQRAQSSSEISGIPLFRGIQYSNTNTDWKVFTS